MQREGQASFRKAGRIVQRLTGRVAGAIVVLVISRGDLLAVASLCSAIQSGHTSLEQAWEADKYFRSRCGKN